MLIEEKKISGILIETIDLNNQVGVVVGIGINVHMSKEEGKEIDQSWISLDEVTDSINAVSYTHLTLPTNREV